MNSAHDGNKNKDKKIVIMELLGKSNRGGSIYELPRRGCIMTVPITSDKLVM